LRTDSSKAGSVEWARAVGKGLAEPDEGVRQLFQCSQGVAQHGATKADLRWIWIPLRFTSAGGQSLWL